MKDLSIRYKILVPVILMGVMLAFMGISSLYSMIRLKEVGEEIVNKYAYNEEMLGDITADYQALRRVAFAHIIADDASMTQTLEDEADSLKESISQESASYEANIESEDEMASFEQFQTDYESYLQIYDKILSYSGSGNKDGATALANTDLREAGVLLSDELNVMKSENKEAMNAAADNQQAVYSSSQRLIAIVMILTAILLVFVIQMCWRWVCRRLININKNLRRIIETIEAGHGDLSLRVPYLCDDEIGNVAQAINIFIETLQGVMGHINESSTQLDTVVDVVSEKVTTANTNVTDISAVMEQLSASMEEISSTVEEVKGSIGGADENISNLADSVEELHTYVGGMRQRADDLKHNANETKQNTSQVVDDIIVSLKQAIEESKSVEQVNSLTDEILGISSQTNLLALNASIEAARAGEAGKGFAVVADEISQLAESSRVAANNIQNINNMVVQAVNELIKNSDAMVKYITENILPDYEGFVHAGEQYSDDAEHVNELVSVFNQMSGDVKEQMHTVNVAVEGIDEAIEESASGVSTAAANTSALVKDIGSIDEAMEDSKQVAAILAEEAEQFVAEEQERAS